MDVERAIFDKIRFYDHVSFAELEKLVDDSYIDEKEDHVFQSDTYKNIIFWISRKKIIIDSIMNLIRDNKIKCNATSSFVYLIDGAMLNLPLVKSSMSYKKPRWCPVTLSPTEKYKVSLDEMKQYNINDYENKIKGILG
jgi:hypothetical protein